MAKSILLVLGILACTAAFCQIAPRSNGKFLKVRGLNIYYEETGKGKPILLMHGFSRSCNDWDGVVEELSKTNRVIAIDMPGHARSDLMDSTNIYLHKRAAGYVIDFVKAMKLDSLQIMGYSSGSFITLYMATIEPTIATKIVLVASQVYYSDSTRKFIGMVGRPDDPDTQKELAATHGAKKGKIVAEQFWHFRKLYGDPSFTPDVLATVKAQTLIVHGDRDPIAPLDNALEMHKYIPRSYLLVMPGCNHHSFFFPEYEAEFIKTVARFFRTGFN